MMPGPPAASEALDLSVVIITRNEEGNIAEVIESVVRAIERAKSSHLLDTHEILLVDSASSDHTVDIASRYPVTIVRLRQSWPVSAAAGRFTGARLAKGKLFLFVDGDYLLNPEWLPVAWSLIQSPSVGAAAGWDLEETTGKSIIALRWRGPQLDDLPPLQEIDSVASGLVKREAYDSVGGIHPYLKGAEDRDFGLRLVQRGWKILRTRVPMGTHRQANPGEPLTYVEYFRSVAVWSLGEGQACRARWSNRDVRRTFLARYGTARYLIQDLQSLVTVVVALINGAGLLIGGVATLVAIALDATILASLHAWRRRHRWSWAEALYELQGIIYGPFRQLLFARGLLRRSPSPESYPQNIELVKVAA